jgi:hypothetical protein
MNDDDLRGGTLIIGSLLWDDGRQNWRDSRLDMALTETVTAPIRYGRLSGKQRGHTYTMVFSRLCATGHAKVVPFLNTVFSSADLIAEAGHLWKAEQPGADAGRISASWGCVALLCNPNRDIPQEFLAGWANRVSHEPDYGNVPQTEQEDCLVTSDGLLRIPWPCRVTDGGAVELDFLLATSNHPTLSGLPPSYPSVETIADAWNRADDTHVEYFSRNVATGIQTFQDEAIRQRLRPRG